MPIRNPISRDVHAALRPAALFLSLSSVFLPLISAASVDDEARLRPENYFEPVLHPGQLLTNVFSRTISFLGPSDMEEKVARQSGTATYKILDGTSADRIKFSLKFRMDGMPSGQADGEFRDHGKTQCLQDKCAVSANASALIYDSHVWGTPTGALVAGKTWTVDLTQPWELGPPGRQTVTVVLVDPANGVAMLKREGSAEGPWDGDKKQVSVKRAGKTYLVDITPGRTHWIGQTVFQRGVLVSDELSAERPVTLSSAEFGSAAATERQYMTMNEAPQ